MVYKVSVKYKLPNIGLFLFEGSFKEHTGNMISIDVSKQVYTRCWSKRKTTN